MLQYKTVFTELNEKSYFDNSNRLYWILFISLLWQYILNLLNGIRHVTLTIQTDFTEWNIYFDNANWLLWSKQLVLVFWQYILAVLNEIYYVSLTVQSDFTELKYKIYDVGDFDGTDPLYWIKYITLLW